MSALFDTNAIRDNNPPELVFSKLDIPFVRKGDKLKADCPSCGKTKKFDYNVSKDVFFCFGCSFGQDCRGVIDLVMAVLGRDFIEACKYLGGATSLTPSEKRAAEDKRKEWAAKAKREETNKLRRTKKQMEDILEFSVPGKGTLAEVYLKTRGHSKGLDALGWPDDIWFHPGLEAFVGEGKERRAAGTFPAMISKGRDHKGKLVLLHRTYLMSKDGDPKNGMVKAVPSLPDELMDEWNAKQMVGVLSRCDSGVFLGASAGITDDPNLPIITAEGIESTYALATAGIKGVFYAALSLNRIVGSVGADGTNIKGWRPPEAGRPVIIAGDNDLSPTPNFPDFEDIDGKKVSGPRAEALFERAGNRLISLGHNTGVWLPPLGCDPEDALFQPAEETIDHEGQSSAGEQSASSAPGEDEVSAESQSETDFKKAIKVVQHSRKASTSYIQRQLAIGYNRAASIIERMEEKGFIGPIGSGGKREIFLPELESEDA